MRGVRVAYTARPSMQELAESGPDPVRTIGPAHFARQEWLASAFCEPLSKCEGRPPHAGANATYRHNRGRSLTPLRSLARRCAARQRWHQWWCRWDRARFGRTLSTGRSRAAQVQAAASWLIRDERPMWLSSRGSPVSPCRRNEELLRYGGFAWVTCGTAVAMVAVLLPHGGRRKPACSYQRICL